MKIFLEYGGTQPPFDNRIWRSRILNNEEYFRRLESYGCDSEIINNNNNINVDLLHQYEASGSDDEIYCDAEDDNKSLDVECDGNSIQFIDTETEDSEEYDSDRVLSPRKKAMPPIESLEEMFLKHEFSTFTLKEKEFEEIKP
jgi:hypothetical protein